MLFWTDFCTTATCYYSLDPASGCASLAVLDNVFVLCYDLNSPDKGCGEGVCKSGEKLLAKNNRLSAITPEVIDSFLTSKASNLSKSSMMHLKAVLNKAFKMAVYPYAYLSESPMKYISLPQKAKETKKEISTITSSQFRMILVLYPVGNPFNIPLQLGFHTGMRLGEILALRWEDVDFKSSRIKVRWNIVDDNGTRRLDSPKTAMSVRDIPISKALIAILEKGRLEQDKDSLFYGQHYLGRSHDFICRQKNGKPLTHSSVQKVSQRITRELRFKFTFHMLRHTHASMLIEQGVPIPDIQARLGLSRMETTMNRYLHPTLDTEKAVLVALDGLANAVGEK